MKTRAVKMQTVSCVALGALLAVFFVGLGAEVVDDQLQADEKTADAATVFTDGRNAFSFPLANLSDAERTRFAVGNSFFKRNWVEAPASTQARDGLGPHFIARSCAGCHMQDGRGQPPDFKRGLSDAPVSLLMRISLPGQGPHGGVNPHPVYGDQINNAAVRGVKPEAQVNIRYTTLRGRFKDGTPYALLKPQYSFRTLAYGPLGASVLVSPRVAPQLIGVGLLEAIPASEIVLNMRRQASLPGSIKGKTNEVWDAQAATMMLGRFGWKANVATLAHQTAGAFVGDMGITSSLFPQESCSPAQVDCLSSARGGKDGQPELDDDAFSDVVFYQAVLAPPARRQPHEPRVVLGQKLFHQAQCAVCHRPAYVTAQGPFPRLTSPAMKGLRIWPYTDLLLHDMGEGLADQRPDGLANGRQWKTPPLWGIGLIRSVNGHTRLLHDGRARGVSEAILWHGGEAQASKQFFLGLSKAQRQALVAFVESL